MKMAIVQGVALGILLVAGGAVCVGDEVPVVGAIRWDAWTGGGITEQVERTLGPAKYHDRLPWFAEVIDDETVRIDGGRQEIMDREIEFAAEAGLDYWAFLVYAKDSSMSTALGQYLNSRKREQMGFCMVLHNTLKAAADRWPEERDRAVALLKEPGYQTVLTDRPLVYAFTGSDFPFDRFAEFLAAARRERIRPYCVFMGWSPAGDYEKVRERGFDAVSAYAMGSDLPTFAGLAESVESGYWRRAASSGVPYVPLVTTGWDKRPRQDNPVSWEKGHGYHEQEVFPARAGAAEIGEHLRNAVQFVGAHREVCRANTVIVYAWNEYDEGGWLAPTRGPDGRPDTSRLDAIGRVLSPVRSLRREIN